MVLEWLRERQGEKLLYSDDKIREFARFLRLGTKKISIACTDEHLRYLYKNPNTLGVLSTALNKGVDIQIVFNGRHETLEEVERYLHIENKELIELKRDYGNLRLYWYPILLSKDPVPFTIVDTEHLCFENPDAEFYEREGTWAVFRYGDPKLGTNWETRFNRYLTKSEEIA